MKTRRLSVLAAAVFTLVLAACSQLDKGEPLYLALQLGPPHTNSAVNVTTNQAGHLYTLTSADYYEFDEDGSEFHVTSEALSRYDRNGNLLWERKVNEHSCPTEPYWEICGYSASRDVAVDSLGNAYILNKYGSEWCDAAAASYGTSITKYNPAGERLQTFDTSTASAFAVDGSGNTYTVGNNDTGFDYCYEEVDDDLPFAQIVRKYSRGGSLVWEQKLHAAVGIPTDVAVASNGNVYVVGNKGMSRYSNSGGRWWTKTGKANEVIIAGSGIVARSGLTVRKYNSSGTQLWSTFIGGLASAYIWRMDGDANGNVYLAGNYLASSSNTDAFVRKLNSSGKSQWTKKFSEPTFSGASGIATHDGSEIYLVGPNYSQPNPDNSSNVFLYKLSSIGNRIWTR